MGGQKSREGERVVLEEDMGSELIGFPTIRSECKERAGAKWAHVE